jgi:hypothetical protein
MEGDKEASLDKSSDFEFEDSDEDFIDEPFLYGDLWYGTADWYRKHYPGFEEEFYEVFEEFSSEHTVNEVGSENTDAE